MKWVKQWPNLRDICLVLKKLPKKLKNKKPYKIKKILGPSKAGCFGGFALSHCLWGGPEGSSALIRAGLDSGSASTAEWRPSQPSEAQSRGGALPSVRNISERRRSYNCSFVFERFPEGGHAASVRKDALRTVFFAIGSGKRTRRCWRGKASSRRSSVSRGSSPGCPASRCSGTAWTKRALSPKTARATWRTRTSANRGDSCRTSSPRWWTLNGASRWSSSPRHSSAAGCCSPWAGGWWHLRTETWTLRVKTWPTA